MKRHFIVILLLAFSAALTAQVNQEAKGAHPYKVEENSEISEEYSHWSLIPHVGANMFDGDFHSEMKHSVSIPTAGLALEYSFTPVWNLGVEYMFDMYKVTGRTEDPENAEAMLRGQMHRAQAYVSMDFMGLFFPKAKKRILGIEPLFGGGYAWYKNDAYYTDAMRYHTGSNTPLSMDHFAGEWFMTGGLNIEFNLNRTLSLGIRGTYTYFINDYIDGRGFSGPQAYASKNNDGIFDLTLNMRFKILAKSKTHVRNISSYEAWAKPIDPCYVHDTVIIIRDTTRIREIVKTKTKVYGEPGSNQPQIYYVYFANNKATLDDKGLITIQQVADRLNEDTTLYAVVTGYCDNTGSAQHNYELGDKRAANVIDELREEYAIAPTHLYSMGMGKVVGRRSQASYGPNRRAAIRLVDRKTFLRMIGNLEDAKENRVVEEAVETKPVKTVPLSRSAKPKAKPNQYQRRTSAEVTVEKSTTLSKLARQYYGNTYCWVYIYIANREKIANPNSLTPGTQLTIPELTEKEMRITKDESLVLFTAARQGK